MFTIQKLIQSEISSLLERSEGFNAITHNTTKGSLREELLIDFFKKLIPNHLDISGGIICDSKGNNSNQTDFIIYDKSCLPRIFLSNNISVIPIESVYLIAEIKTTLRIADLKQIEKAHSNFYGKLHLAITEKENNNFQIPSVIIAYDNKVGKSELKKWMLKMPNVTAICIINKYTFGKIGNGESISEFSKIKEIDYNETLHFYSQLYNTLVNTKENRKITPLWAAYIQGGN